ncbi:hypothetical protein BH11MYX3_BH11MYX3_16140 [soil metagenome]
MKVSTRISIALLITASACGDPSSTRRDDDHVDAGDEVSTRCSMPIACPAPSSATKQTICGQLYDFESNAVFADQVATTCTAATPSGPCSLAIEAYDVISFSVTGGQAAPLAHGPVEIDGCGRYRIPDIEVPGGPFIGIVVDDVSARGPSGTTVPTVIAAVKIAGTATQGVETWIVREATTSHWASTGGPPLASGVFVPVFRAHATGLETQSGVTFTSTSTPSGQFYFDAAAMPRTTIDAEAVATGVNGTALVTDATYSAGVAYSGTGGLANPASCTWAIKPGASIPGTVFIQLFRPTNVVGQTCTL